MAPSSVALDVVTGTDQRGPRFPGPNAPGPKASLDEIEWPSVGVVADVIEWRQDCPRIHPIARVPTALVPNVVHLIMVQAAQVILGLASGGIGRLVADLYQRSFPAKPNSSCESEGSCGRTRGTGRSKYLLSGSCCCW